MASSMRCGRKPNAEAQCRPTRARPCTRTPRGPAEVSDLIRWSLATADMRSWSASARCRCAQVRVARTLRRRSRLFRRPQDRAARREFCALLERGRAGGLHDREWARPDAVRLEEMRAIAEDDRGEALLALGDALAAVPLLTAAASASPLRERTHALLMTALHRCGRQAEALRVFQQFRHRLGTDLGLKPGDAITGLERSITRVANVRFPTASSGRVVPGYVLHERIGDGMFAVVYSGRQPSVERDVAIKVIRAELANRPEFVRRFEAEAQLVAGWSIRTSCRCMTSGARGSAYLVMRLFPTGTLEHRISNRPLELQDVSRLVSQIGAALATAHTAGVVHRDVKPANICLRQGNFYLGDFGIAHDAMSAPTATDSISVAGEGAPHPSSCAVSPSARHRICTVWPSPCSSHCRGGHRGTATTRAPRRTCSTGSSTTRCTVAAAARASTPDVAARLDSVLARAAAKDPAQRHASVDEFVSDFLVPATSKRSNRTDTTNQGHPDQVRCGTRTRACDHSTRRAHFRLLRPGAPRRPARRTTAAMPTLGC